MAYGLTLVILPAVLIAVQLAIRYWARLVEREQRPERRTFESWREPPPEQDTAAERDDAA